MVRESFDQLLGNLGAVADQVAAEIEAEAPEALSSPREGPPPAKGSAARLRAVSARPTAEDRVRIEARQVAIRMAAAGATRAEVSAH